MQQDKQEHCNAVHTNIAMVVDSTHTKLYIRGQRAAAQLQHGTFCIQATESLAKCEQGSSMQVK